MYANNILMLLPGAGQHRSSLRYSYVAPTSLLSGFPRPIHHSLTLSQSDVEATCTLTLSSVLGIAADRCGIFGGTAGTVLTLFTAAFLSNTLGLAPHSHKLYDLCWSKILPATLALTFLNDDSPEGTDGDATIRSNKVYDEKLYPVQRKIFASICMSFFLASIGTISNLLF